MCAVWHYSWRGVHSHLLIPDRETWQIKVGTTKMQHDEPMTFTEVVFRNVGEELLMQQKCCKVNCITKAQPSTWYSSGSCKPGTGPSLQADQQGGGCPFQVAHLAWAFSRQLILSAWLVWESLGDSACLRVTLNNLYWRDTKWLQNGRHGSGGPCPFPFPLPC